MRTFERRAFWYAGDTSIISARVTAIIASIVTCTDAAANLHKLVIRYTRR